MLISTRSTVGVDGTVGYRYYINHSYFQRRDSRGYGARRGIRSEDINDSSFLNVGESVDGNGRRGSKSQTRPSTYCHSGDIGRSSGFYIHGDNRSGHGSQTIQFYSYNHGVLNISHPSFTQEAIPRGVKGENIHQNHPYYYYTIIPTHPHSSIPKHHHKQITLHLYPIITPHKIGLCPY